MSKGPNVYGRDLEEEVQALKETKQSIAEQCFKLDYKNEGEEPNLAGTSGNARQRRTVNLENSSSWKLSHLSNACQYESDADDASSFVSFTYGKTSKTAHARSTHEKLPGCLVDRKNRRPAVSVPLYSVGHSKMKLGNQANATLKAKFFHKKQAKRSADPAPMQEDKTIATQTEFSGDFLLAPPDVIHYHAGNPILRVNLGHGDELNIDNILANKGSIECVCEDCKRKLHSNGHFGWTILKNVVERIKNFLLPLPVILEIFLWIFALVLLADFEINCCGKYPEMLNDYVIKLLRSLQPRWS